MQQVKPQFRSFAEFYPYYLNDHTNKNCRRFHFVGTTLVLVIFAYGAVSGSWSILLLIPLAGYGFAWAGHVFFEKNRPATFTHPFYSLFGDFVMYGDILTGRISM